MDTNGVVPTMDIGGGCGGSWIFLFAILALFLFGGGFGGKNGNTATTEDLNTVADFTRLESSVQNNGSAVQQGFTNIGNGISSLGYEMANKFGEVARQNCELKTTILESKNEIMDSIKDTELQNLRSQVSKLETQQTIANALKCNGMFPNFPNI